jgi:hypothetical protein
MKSEKVLSNSYKLILALVAILIIVFIAFKIQWTLYVASCLALIGAFSEHLTFVIYTFFGMLSKMWSTIIITVILTVVFYFFLTPLAFLTRLFIKNHSFLSTKNNRTSFFQDRHISITATDFEKPW